jgi:hypothetical protein
LQKQQFEERKKITMMSLKAKEVEEKDNAARKIKKI